MALFRKKSQSPIVAPLRPVTTFCNAFFRCTKNASRKKFIIKTDFKLERKNRQRNWKCCKYRFFLRWSREKVNRFVDEFSANAKIIIEITITSATWYTNILKFFLVFNQPGQRKKTDFSTTIKRIARFFNDENNKCTAHEIPNVLFRGEREYK